MKLIFNKKSYHNYIKDNLFDEEVFWHWKWRKEDVEGLHAKCPNCSKVLVYDENFNNNCVYFYCDACDIRHQKIRGGDYSYSKFLLEREIKRKAQVGKYKTK